ncbi:cytochrome d ubiquinol oxidase subunit II [Piscirickettsia litoralis]|uniref:Cytochrome d ubiquinol oxidase subunit II n=1 Tax=Piscirickettsia litoralis TaxID=1891921 RepID=A0ABX3ABA8_9GAMM|nr:cytochrome d ubiquinol oxidase subunit II [Piscirickettsia litoralis]ODN43424.1 cytochrome d ubiquinol oxidase subunit II [Piscirickettsia litoralis]
MFDFATMQVIGWLIVGLTLILFALTSGFDSGVGILLPFIGKNDTERRLALNVIGPTWDGNQVWLITAGGAIFAIWPTVYATAFSGYYIAMLLVLWSLFLRPVGFEYRSKLPSQKWRNSWDIGIFIASFVPIVVMGVAFGNLLLGSPFNYDAIFLRMDYTGSFWNLLTPFALLCGVVSLCMIVTHGAAYLSWRAEGIVKIRAQKALCLFAVLYVIAFAAAGILIAYKVPGYTLGTSAASINDPLANEVTRKAGAWIMNYHSYPWMIIAPALGFLGAILAILATKSNKRITAFIGSCGVQVGTILTAGFSLFPFIMPSSTDPAHSLTVWNSSTTLHSLNLITIVAVVMVPVIAIYTAFVYRKIWRDGALKEQDIQRDQHTFY